ncbi:MAG: hypothetical protein ABSE08_20515, partial [Syntrophobacteraceae bacterium]
MTSYYSFLSIAPNLLCIGEQYLLSQREKGISQHIGEVSQLSPDQYRKAQSHHDLEHQSSQNRQVLCDLKIRSLLSNNSG